MKRIDQIQVSYNLLVSIAIMKSRSAIHANSGAFTAFCEL